MTDEPQEQRASAPPGRAAPADDGPSRGASQPPPADDDPDAALERLEALSKGGKGEAAAPAAAASRPATPAAPASGAPRGVRARPAGSPSGGRTIARFAAPAVFLVACIVLLAIVFNSGVIGGKTTPTPTPAATHTKAATKTTFKIYRVKRGDTLSGIAVKFHVTSADLQAANPAKSMTTLTIGERLRIPVQSP